MDGSSIESAPTSSPSKASPSCVQDKSGPTMGGILYSNPLLKRYPKGATVTVYYNPQDPKESALER